jgi:sulfoxide reductase heme-binding subunit YedZ
MAIDVHRQASLLALGLALLHSFVLLGDRYVRFTVGSVLLPFASPTEHWIAIGIGQLALYLLAVVMGSFYVRRAIGTRLWRAIHFASFAVFAMATLHGVQSGNDDATALSWLGGGTVSLLTIHRLIRVALRVAKPASPAAG